MDDDQVCGKCGLFLEDCECGPDKSLGRDDSDNELDLGLDDDLDDDDEIDSGDPDDND
jgi:hypothetical protein